MSNRSSGLDGALRSRRNGSRLTPGYTDREENPWSPHLASDRDDSLALLLALAAIVLRRYGYVTSFFGTGRISSYVVGRNG
ncbi:MAG: hypothetical protein ACR2GT_11965 [Gaiellaceae bacterium]